MCSLCSPGKSRRLLRQKRGHKKHSRRAPDNSESYHRKPHQAYKELRTIDPRFRFLQNFSNKYKFFGSKNYFLKIFSMKHKKLFVKNSPVPIFSPLK